MTGAWFYGDFFVPKDPYIVPVEKFIGDPKTPYWDPDQWLPAMRKLYSWNGKVYGVLFDGDAQALYYRKDVFTKKEIQDKFKAKYNYDLPAPPKTTKEYHDVADFFTGWDWNGDGQNDWGISLHAKVNEQGFFHFLTLSAPFVISPDNKYYFFNPDTMKPLINSEGHVQALEDYVKFLANGPKEEISWTLGQGWNLFLSGNSATEPTWGDLPTLAQDPKTSKVQGKMGAAPLPGTTEAFNPITGQWKKYDLNQVGNTNGGSWHCVISRLSKKQEATYDFLAFMANKKNALFNCANGWTGVQPGMKFEYFPPIGTGNVERVEGARLERGRRGRVSQGLLCRARRAGSAGISAHPRRGRILARARRQRLGGARRPDAAEGGARRHRGGLGEDHRPLRARQAEGAVPGVVRLNAAAARGPRPDARRGAQAISDVRADRCNDGGGRAWRRRLGFDAWKAAARSNTRCFCPRSSGSSRSPFSR